MSKKVVLISLGLLIIIVPIIESKLSHNNDETNFIPSLDAPRIAAIGSFGEDDSSDDIDEDFEIGTD